MPVSLVGDLEIGRTDTTYLSFGLILLSQFPMQPWPSPHQTQDQHNAATCHHVRILNYPPLHILPFEFQPGTDNIDRETWRRTLE